LIEGLGVALQVGVWLGLLLSAWPVLHREWRARSRGFRAGVLVIAGAAAAISLGFFPALRRYEALGHEAGYLDCFLGRAPPGPEGGWAPFVTYPVLRWSMAWIGMLAGHKYPQLPLMGTALVAAAAVPALALLSTAMSRREATGLAAALLLALHPIHAFWGGTVYNIAVPFSALCLSVLLAVLALRDGSARALLASAASAGLAVATRVEWALLAPALGLLLLGLRRTLRSGAAAGNAAGLPAELPEGLPRPRLGPLPWLSATALGGAYVAALFLGGGALTEQGGYHGWLGYLQTAARQAALPDLLRPFDPRWALPLAAAGALLWRRSGGAAQPVGWGAPLGLLGFFTVALLGLATFNDFGPRHALLPGLAVLLALSMLALPQPPGERVLSALSTLALTLVAGVLALGLLRVRPLYFQTPEEFRAAHPVFREQALDLEALVARGCYFLSDDARLWDRGVAGSHFNLMDPGEAVLRWRQAKGCVIWLQDYGQSRWDGLDVWPRSAKLLRWFHWRPIGWVAMQGGLEAIALEMTAPPFGVPDGAAAPPTEFRLPDKDLTEGPSVEPEPEPGPDAEPELPGAATPAAPTTEPPAPAAR
jgi:hypothetical protein